MFQRFAPLLALLLTLPLAACGSSSGAPACSSNADCASDQFCELGVGASRMELDEPCFLSCVFDSCDGSDPACELDCANTCSASGESCASICGDLCSDFGSFPADAVCAADCVPGCEANRGGPGPVTPDAGPGPSPADAGPTPAPSSGTCQPRATPTPTPDAGPTPADSGPPPSTSIVWAGTWTARATYTARCRPTTLHSWVTTEYDFSVSARIEGPNADLRAVFADDSAYTMVGSGGDSRLRLSGVFPGRDHNGNTATGVMRDNTVSISVDEVLDDRTARGSIEGNYDTTSSNGNQCEIQSGGVELSR